VPLVAALLIARLGWRDAYLVLGIAAALIGGSRGPADRERSARAGPRA
jgi:hypothetical protein